MKEVNLPRRWSEISYPGETRVSAGLATRAGSWPTLILRRGSDGEFLDGDGRLISPALRQPDTINFETELAAVRQALRDVTPEQIAIARYWNEGPAAKQWVPIIDILLGTYGLGTPRAERIWGAAQAGANDAMAVTWHLKYLWDVARPVQLDPKLVTVFPTPKHPTYPAGHAVIAGYYQAVLAYFFAPEADRLAELAEECAISRLYAGVHFPADLEDGLRLGRQIGGIVTAFLARQHDQDGVLVDYPLTENRHAELPPPPYEQVIPTPRP